MWNFDDPTKPVIGMYGMKNADDERVSQLGWIQLDTVCQDAYDAAWTPGADPLPVPPTPQPEPEPETEEEPSSGSEPVPPTPAPTPSGDSDWDIIN